MTAAMIDTKLLKSQLVLKGVNTKDLAEAQGWSNTTANRKVNGKSAFTAPEIQVLVELLNLDTEIASQIFFAEKVS